MTLLNSVPLSMMVILASGASAQAQQLVDQPSSARTAPGRISDPLKGMPPKFENGRPFPDTPKLRYPIGVLAVSDNNGHKNGAYISSINGIRRLPIVLHYGMTLAIRGAQLGILREGSLVGLFPPGVTTGMSLQILSWNDTEIRVKVPASGNFPQTDAATLSIYAYNKGASDTDIKLRGVTFDRRAGRRR